MDAGAPPERSQELISRLLVACMVIGFLALVGAGVAAAWVTSRNEEHTRWVNHTYEVAIAVREAEAKVEQAETSRRGYLLTDQRTYLDTYRLAAIEVDSAIGRLAALTADNARQQARIARLRRVLARLRDNRAVTIQLMSEGKRAEAAAAFTGETSSRQLRVIRALFADMGDQEQQLLAIRDADQRASVAGFYWVLIGAGALLALVALLSLGTVLRYTRDLTGSRNALRGLNASLEDLVAERTADLTRANEEIQRFAYIVSHDLRSPLVNVMGFTSEMETATRTLAEMIEQLDAADPTLVGAEARLAATEDLPEAIRFIRTSSQKMDRLINAILRLSREGRRVLTPERLDLTQLATTVRDSLIQMAEERGAVIEVLAPLPAIQSDRIALEQILSNLVENAVKYLDKTRPGHIVVRGRAEGRRRIVEVADNGRGIDPRDHARVFDLFRRSGAQDQPGEGIGLAHVRALVYRLGGLIEVQSTLGQGATFRVTLPDTLSEPQDKPR